MELLSIAQDMRDRRIPITYASMNAELTRLGYKVTTNDGAAGKLRQWLGTAGIVDKDWAIDSNRLAVLTGTSLSDVGAFQSQTHAQRAFVATIRRIAETRGQQWISSPELLDFVRAEHGPVFDPSQVKRKVYAPLVEAGWIEHEVKAAGRGGKGGRLRATTKLIDVDFELLVNFKPGNLPADLRAAMATPLDQVYADLKSADTHVKGIALELLAVNIASDLGLVPLKLRVRGVSTGGAEVDLVAEGAHLHFTRWIFQCKNTASVDVGVLAKEIGMATLLQAQVIVIATTGKISGTVRTYADQIALTTPFQVVLLDRGALESYRTGGALALRDGFRRDASTVMMVKRPQVLDTLDEIARDES